MQTKAVSRILNRYKGNRTALISILQDIQQEFTYLPSEVLESVSKQLDLKLIDVYSVATFYKSLRLSPQGEHSIVLCMGTACHVRNARRILDEIQSQLGIGPGDTTKDRKFTFDTVNCLGACAIGPVMVVDNKYYGHMNPIKTRQILSYLKKEIKNNKR